MKNQAITLAKRRGFTDIQAIMQVGNGLYRAYSAGKSGNVELLIDIREKTVREVG